MVNTLSHYGLESKGIERHNIKWLSCRTTPVVNYCDNVLVLISEAKNCLILKAL